MKARGDDLLQALVKAEQTPLFAYDGVPAYRLAADVDRAAGRDRSPDGRTVTPQLYKLRDAGLAEKIGTAGSYWKATDRGRDVDVMLEHYTASRGGEFRPRREFLDTRELLALG